VKIFISYSSDDLALAQRVFGEMVRGGAEAFQYGESEIIGKPSWEQVLDWISASDVFIVLISQSALRSKPVKEEIDHAHYSYINSERPEKLVAAVIEGGAKPPRLIERFARVDLVDYDAGMGRLLGQLGLTRKSATRQPPKVSLPDVSTLFKDYKGKHPGPSAASLFSNKAEKLVANYDFLQPAGITGPQRATHIDSLLAELAEAPAPPETTTLGEADALFLGYRPGKGLYVRPRLAQSLLEWKPAQTTLSAPTLSYSGFQLTWTEVPDAVGYALEGALLRNFTKKKELYRGPDREFSTLGKMETHFRVKAIGGVFTSDSPWSNVIVEELLPTIPLPFTLKPFSATPWASREKLKTPQLTINLSMVGWSSIEGASSYVLERADEPTFASPETIYEGEMLIHFDMAATATPCYYRVKAIGGLMNDDSDWSAIGKRDRPGWR
jgi:TIR domain